MSQFEGVEPTGINMKDIESMLRIELRDGDYLVDDGGPIKQFAVQIQSDDPDDISIYMSVELRDGQRGSDVLFKIMAFDVEVTYTDQELPIESTTTSFDAIAAYNRAMGILDTR